MTCIITYLDQYTQLLLTRHRDFVTYAYILVQMWTYAMIYDRLITNIILQTPLSERSNLHKKVK